jgi:CMP-N-acetylneuraminic acid synthetase
MSKFLYFIPARGGSKGIKDKNLQMVGRNTLIKRAVDTGFDSGLKLNMDTTVVVSTQDSAIAAEASNSGAMIHNRPQEICGDDATTEQALIHFLNNQWPSVDLSETYIALVQCTSPFTSSEDVTEGITQVVAGSDSSFLGSINHYWLYKVDQITNSFAPIGHELGFRPSRQRVQEQIHETGAGYFFRADKFLEEKFRLFGKISAVGTGLAESIDIDEVGDLKFAQVIAKGLSLN